MSCLVVDIVIGDEYYKILRRLLAVYLKTIFPNDNPDTNYLKKIHNIIENILEPEIRPYIKGRNRKLYEPAELSKRLVSNQLKVKLDLTDQYQDDDPDSLFSNVENMLLSNSVYVIDEEASVMKYLRNEVNPYFKQYYIQSIKLLIAMSNNIDNYIWNQQIHLHMLKTMLENLCRGSSFDSRCV